jgi:hypothetical protein
MIDSTFDWRKHVGVHPGAEMMKAEHAALDNTAS